MTIRLIVDIAYNCRPKRGERRAKDGTGRLVQSVQHFGATLAQCAADARESRAASERVAPGYSEVIGWSAYDDAAFRADPFKCKPLFAGSGPDL